MCHGKGREGIKKKVKENSKKLCTCLCVLSQGCCFRGPRFAEHLDLSGGWDVDGARSAGGHFKMGLRQWDGSVPDSAKQAWKNTWKDSGDSHCSQVWSVTPGSQEGNGIGSSDSKSCGLFWGMQVAHTAPLHCLTFWPSTVGLRAEVQPLHLAHVEHSHDLPHSRRVGMFLGVVASQDGQSAPGWVSWPGPGAVLLHVLATAAGSAGPLRPVLCPHHPCACFKGTWQGCRCLSQGEEDPRGFFQ